MCVGWRLFWECLGGEGEVVEGGERGGGDEEVIVVRHLL